MPVMGPLTELMGLNPEAAVTALQFANQTINTISPVAGMTVAGLAVAQDFVWPMVEDHLEVLHFSWSSLA